MGVVGLGGWWTIQEELEETRLDEEKTTVGKFHLGATMPTVPAEEVLPSQHRTTE